MNYEYGKSRKSLIPDVDNKVSKKKNAPPRKPSPAIAAKRKVYSVPRELGILFATDPSNKADATCRLAGEDLQTTDNEAVESIRMVCRGCADNILCAGYAVRIAIEQTEAGQEVAPVGIRGGMTDEERLQLLARFPHYPHKNNDQQGLLNLWK